MATHIKSLNIESFRGLEGLKIENLGDVNIIVGDNNTGKTSVLEAIQLLCEPTEYNMATVAMQREKFKDSYFRIGLMDAIRYLFTMESKKKGSYNLKIKAEIYGKKYDVSVLGKDEIQIYDFSKLEGDGKQMRAFYFPLEQPPQNEVEEVDTLVGNICIDGKKNKAFELNKYTNIRKSTETHNALVNVMFISAMEHIAKDSFMNITQRADLSKKAVELLNKFDSRIVDIRYIGEGGRKFIPVFELEGVSEYIPLSLFGDGMKKALTVLNAIIGAVIDAEDGVVLIDEFETSLHTTAMDQVFKFMLTVAKELNVQLFLTTHSLEAIDTLLRCDEENVDKIKVVRLRKNDSKGAYAETIDGTEALIIRKKYKMEIRL